MSSKDANKPVGKSARRNAKGKQRRQKPDSVESAAPVQMQNPEPELPQYTEPDQAPSLTAGHEPADLEAAVNEAMVDKPVVDEPVVNESVVNEPVVNEPIEAAVAAPDVLPAAAPSPAEPAPVSLQTIANAYRDYTRKSFEEIGCYFEQLTGARSLDRAMKVQTDFMKRAYETSVAESQRICELHSRLARQTFQPFQGLVGKRPETRSKS